MQCGGDKISEPAPLFIGAAWTPLGPPVEFRVIRLAKKIKAGADFIQTQAVYDVPAFAAQMAKAVDMGLTEQAAILPGIIVPRSARHAQLHEQERAGGGDTPGTDKPHEGRQGPQGRKPQGHGGAHPGG